MEAQQTTRGAADWKASPMIRKSSALRARQIRNALTLNLLSVGTPLLLMGDEVRRTQLGNNNAYCQNNEVSWFDWSLCQRHADLHRFVQFMI
jgi:isoamylase